MFAASSTSARVFLWNVCSLCTFAVRANTGTGLHSASSAHASCFPGCTSMLGCSSDSIEHPPLLPTVSLSVLCFPSLFLFIVRSGSGFRCVRSGFALESPAPSPRCCGCIVAVGAMLAIVAACCGAVWRNTELCKRTRYPIRFRCIDALRCGGKRMRKLERDEEREREPAGESVRHFVWTLFMLQPNHARSIDRWCCWIE